MIRVIPPGPVAITVAPSKTSPLIERARASVTPADEARYHAEMRIRARTRAELAETVARATQKTMARRA